MDGPREMCPGHPPTGFNQTLTIETGASDPAADVVLLSSRTFCRQIKLFPRNGASWIFQNAALIRGRIRGNLRWLSSREDVDYVQTV